MNVERSIGRHRIGGWEFSPATGELRRRTDLRRLEPRAARALQMLCEAAGEVVSQEQLIEGVWQGRALSENSVAVVIGQLRRALDDDAREPKLIETIPKRGYRLHSAGVATRPPAKRRLMLALGAVLLALLIAGGAWMLSSGRATAVTVADVANATGNAAYDPLARATSELIVNQLGQRGFAVRRDGAGELRLESKLVMWDGLPFLGITVTDRAGEVRWSAMMKATAGRIPSGVDGALDEFEAKLGGEVRLAEQRGAR